MEMCADVQAPNFTGGRPKCPECPRGRVASSAPPLRAAQQVRHLLQTQRGLALGSHGGFGGVPLRSEGPWRLCSGSRDESLHSPDEDVSRLCSLGHRCFGARPLPLLFQRLRGTREMGGKVVRDGV